MATKQATATKAPEAQAEQTARTVTVTKVVQVPMLKRCAAHAANFPNEDEVRPISEFWGKVPGSYCSRCASLKHKATRGAETERRRKERAEYRDLKAKRALYEAFFAEHGELAAR